MANADAERIAQRCDGKTHAAALKTQRHIAGAQADLARDGAEDGEDPVVDGEHPLAVRADDPDTGLAARGYERFLQSLAVAADFPEAAAEDDREFDSLGSAFDNGVCRQVGANRYDGEIAGPVDVRDIGDAGNAGDRLVFRIDRIDAPCISRGQQGLDRLTSDAGQIRRCADHRDAARLEERVKSLGMFAHRGATPTLVPPQTYSTWPVT